jgi:hypothetical protein
MISVIVDNINKKKRKINSGCSGDSECRDYGAEEIEVGI